MNREEAKEQIYRKDPTFTKEKEMPICSGGSIETIFCLQNGHIAISGANQFGKTMHIVESESLEIV